MIQQAAALIIIFFFIFRLFWQKRNKTISNNEYIFWLFFWLISATTIIFIKWIDKFVAFLGFSGSGIQVLFYFSIVVIFFLIFRIRLRQERMEKNITKIIKHISLEKK